MTRKIILQLDEESYWKLQERAVAKRMDLEDWILQELNVTRDEENVTEFGEYVVEALGVSGQRRRENARRAAQYMYDHEERNGDQITRDVWVKAVRYAVDEAKNERPNKIDRGYDATIRKAFYDSGLNGEAEIRSRIADLIDQWEARENEVHAADQEIVTDADETHSEEHTITFWQDDDLVHTFGDTNQSDVMAAAVDLLIRNHELIGQFDSFPYVPGKKRAILNTEPVHPTGEKMALSRELSDGYYLFTGVPKNDKQRYVSQFAELCGLTAKFDD